MDDTADIDPYREITAVWEGHDDEEYRRDQSHWRGHGRWDDDRWLALGRALVQRVGDLYRMNGRDPGAADGFGRVLEWGPGGGANLFALAARSTRLYGVDISAKNLEEAGRQLGRFGEGRFVPLLLEADPGSIAAHVDAPLDLFFSSTVFQHFPSQEYGLDVLRTAFDLLDDGGLGYVQIRYDDGNPKYAPKRLEQYSQSHLYATSYQLTTFWKALEDIGFRPLKIANLNTTVNYAAFYFAKPR